MGRGYPKSGFTLIELMMAIAVLATTASILCASLFQFGGLTRERDYARSLGNAGEQLAQLRRENFDKLPPEVLTVGAGGLVSVSQSYLVPGSLKVWGVDDGAEISPSGDPSESGKLTLPAKPGQKVVVSYEYYVEDRGEAHFLEKDGTVALQNTPVERVVKVQLASGDKLTPATYDLMDGGRLKVKNGKTGQLVVVDYLGRQWGNTVGGQFLDEELQPTLRPTDTKLLTVGEKYPGAWRNSIPLVKVRP